MKQFLIFMKPILKVRLHTQPPHLTAARPQTQVCAFFAHFFLAPIYMSMPKLLVIAVAIRNRPPPIPPPRRPNLEKHSLRAILGFGEFPPWLIARRFVVHAWHARQQPVRPRAFHDSIMDSMKIHAPPFPLFKWEMRTFH